MPNRIEEIFYKIMILKKYQKLMILFFVVIVAGGLFLFAEPASAVWYNPVDWLESAANSLATDVLNALIHFVSWMMLLIAGLFLKLAVFFLNLLIRTAEYSDFMNAPPVLLGWIMMRDLANMFFIVALLVIAFGTVLGIEKYEWKKSLVKLVLVAIFINFSKLILQLIIDAAHIVTITYLSAFKDASAGNLIKMFKLNEVITMTKEAVSSKGNIKWDILVSSVFGLILASLTMATVGAYLVIMLARLVMLWLLMIISPLAFIAQVFPFAQKFANEFWTKFIHHVVVAPIMVFFLWLTFATIGTGTIARDIGIETSQFAAFTATGGVSSNITVSAKPKVALNRASTWENLSSFAIAMAFMVAGLTIVQKLGVAGGSMAGGAMSFGKQVATMATGISTGQGIARWGVAKGKRAVKGAFVDMPLGAGKYALKKAPVVGTDSLRRKGAWAKGKAMQAYSRAPGIGAKARVDRAKKWEGAGFKRDEEGKIIKDKEGARVKEEGWKAFGARLLGGTGASLIEGSGRKDKRAKDWEEGIENEKKIIESGYSTSSSASGQFKLDTEVKLELEEELKPEKKAGKKLTRKEQLMKGESREAERYQKRAGIITDTKIATDQLKKKRELEEQRKGMEKRMELAEGKGGAGEKYLEREEAISGTEADIVKMRPKEAIGAAERKAGVYREKGPEFALRAAAIEANAASEFAEEESKLLGGMNYHELMTKGGEFSNRLKTAVDSGEDKDAVRSLKKQNVALLTTAFSQGSESGMDTLRTMMDGIGWDWEEEGLTHENRTRAILSVVSGKKVGVDEAEKSERELSEAFDSPSIYNYAMRNLDKAAKHAASDGAPMAAGFVNTEVEEKGGRARVVYGLGSNFGNKTTAGKDITKPRNFNTNNGNVGYFAARQNLSNVETVGDFGSSDLSGNLTDFNIDERTGEDHQHDDRDSLVALFKGQKSLGLSKMKGSLRESIKNIVIKKDKKGESKNKLKAQRIAKAFLEAKNGLADDIAKNEFVDMLSEKGGLMDNLEGVEGLDISELKKQVKKS